jgi:polar amino acid transport system substrate-binding protein
MNIEKKPIPISSMLSIITIGTTLSMLIFLLPKIKDNSANMQLRNNSTYNQLLNNGEIKVGYIVYPPGIIKDPNTGKLSGIFYDVIEKMGENLNLNINWSEEISYGTAIEGLEAGKYDMVPPIWATASRGKSADFSIPLMYSAVGIYARSDDNRFNNNVDSINSKNIRIATIDGELAETITEEDFSSAQKISLPQLSQVSEMLLSVQDNKADVAFVETPVATEYMSKNPGKLKNIVPNDPIRLYANEIMYKKGENNFGTMIDTALQEMLDNGFVNKTIKKYMGNFESLYPVSKPFESPGN